MTNRKNNWVDWWYNIYYIVNGEHRALKPLVLQVKHIIEVDDPNPSQSGQAFRRW